MEDELFKLYALAEMRYQEHFKNYSQDDLYPPSWYQNKNYKLKIEIIVEAIQTNTLIINTKSFSKMIENNSIF